MTAPDILEDRYACDLCPRYWPGEPRACGIDFIHGFWACLRCIVEYRRRGTPGQRRSHAA